MLKHLHVQQTPKEFAQDPTLTPFLVVHSDLQIYYCVYLLLLFVIVTQIMRLYFFT
jgi:hypothetical protein